MTTAAETTAPASRMMARLQPPEKREVTSFEKFRAQLNACRRDVAKMIGEANIDKFIRVCLTAVQYEPALLSANRKTLLIACLEAAQDGLLPDGSEAVFNIYPTKVKEGNVERWVDTVQYLPMAYGLVQRMYEIPGVVNVDGRAVYERDIFKFLLGDDPKIEHEPYAGSEEPGKIVAAYVVVKFSNGERKREVMFRRDIEKVRKKSKQPNGLMWDETKGFYDQGAIKSVIHRVFKQLPQAERLKRALRHDNNAAGLAEIVDIPADASGENLEEIIAANVTLIEESPKGAATERVPTVAGKADERVVEGTIVEGETKATKPAAVEEPPRPKPGEPGTAEMKTKLTERMKDCKDPDALDIMMDDVRSYSWPKDDLAAMEKVYRERRAEIVGARG